MTAALMTAAGAALVFGAASTTPAYEFGMIATVAASVVGGCVAARNDAEPGRPERPVSASRRMTRGVVTGLAFLLVVGAVVMVVGMYAFEHSNYVW
jgi:hypothetical protein